MRYDAIAKKSIYTVTRAVHKLVRNYELERLVLFFQRADGRNGKNSFNSELFETVNIRAKVQFSRQKAMATSVASEESNLFPFQGAQNVGVGWRAERSRLLHLV